MRCAELAGFVGYDLLMPPKGSRLAERVQVICPCGVEFAVTKKRFEDGRGRRCSKACQYTHMERPSGLKYKIVKDNPTSFKPGQQPWNEGRYKSEVGYNHLHKWVRKHKQKTGTCEHCQTAGFTQWANKSHEYKRSLDDWLELCRKCHRRYDASHRGAAMTKFDGNLR
jgi:hypothetical protein